MTIDEKMAAKAQIISDHANARARLAKLTHQAKTVMSKLVELSQQINNYESFPADFDFTFLNADEIKRLVSDLQQTAKMTAELAAKLSDMGITNATE